MSQYKQTIKLIPISYSEFSADFNGEYIKFYDVTFIENWGSFKSGDTVDGFIIYLKTGMWECWSWNNQIKDDKNGDLTLTTT